MGVYVGFGGGAGGGGSYTSSIELSGGEPSEGRGEKESSGVNIWECLLFAVLLINLDVLSRYVLCNISIQPILMFSLHSIDLPFTTCWHID